MVRQLKEKGEYNMRVDKLIRFQDFLRSIGLILSDTKCEIIKSYLFQEYGIDNSYSLDYAQRLKTEIECLEGEITDSEYKIDELQLKNNALNTELEKKNNIIKRLQEKIEERHTNHGMFRVV